MLVRLESDHPLDFSLKSTAILRKPFTNAEFESDVTEPLDLSVPPQHMIASQIGTQLLSDIGLQEILPKTSPVLVAPSLNHEEPPIWTLVSQFTCSNVTVPWHPAAGMQEALAVDTTSAKQWHCLGCLAQFESRCKVYCWFILVVFGVSVSINDNSASLYSRFVEVVSIR